MRYALYFTPPAQDPLTREAVGWLGRDAFSGVETVPAVLPGISPEEAQAAAAAPRRYGFHATLKAPFRLAPNRCETELLAALRRFCAAHAPFTGPRLALSDHDGFLALTPAEPSPALDAFAAAVVEAFEPFRAPLSESETARRRPERLAPAERANLARWGYPYVFEAFRFHMTLTGALAPSDLARLRRVLEARFAPLLDAPLAVGALALFGEPHPGAPFTVRSLAPLSGSGR